MLLQRLGEYADREMDLPPPMYQEQPVRYVIDLDTEGRLLAVLDTADPAVPATKRGVRRLVPHVVRTSGVRAKLLVDKGSYAIGFAPADAAGGRERREHEAFVELAWGCALATNEPAVLTVVQFIEQATPEVLGLPADYDPEAQVTFRVDGCFPIDLPAVRDYWASLQAGDDRPEMPCVVCGLVRPAMSSHPVPIKPLPSGQTSGNFLISANAKAFESYGLRGSLIAPTCAPCAEKYGNALNALLRDTASRLWVGDAAYVFWTAEASGFWPGRMLSEPDAEEVRELVDAARSGRRGAAEVEPTAFFALGLSASGARVVVRSWIDTTVGEAKRRLGRWFALQELVAWDGAPGEALSAWRLAKATERSGGKDAPRAEVADALVGSALGGTALPLDLLYQAVRRCRAEQGVSRERAVLMKMVLGSRGLTREGDGAMAELEIENREPAYLCGRLLAVLEAIQRRALGNPNATIVDRYYGTASSAPASVFGTLLHGAQPHLSKLRKDPRSQGAQRALERRLEEVMAPLGGFPKTLTLQEQGLFALGFYHQRASDRRAAREHREAADAVRDGADEEDVAEVVGMP